MNVNFVKVTAESEEVKILAKEMGITAVQVAQVINNQRYRAAYNKAKLDEAKKMREFFKAHPELMPKE